MSFNLQVFATPETLIGFHPDAGASFYLSHLPGHVGTLAFFDHVCLTWTLEYSFVGEVKRKGDNMLYDRVVFQWKGLG